MTSFIPLGRGGVLAFAPSVFEYFESSKFDRSEIEGFTEYHSFVHRLLDTLLSCSVELGIYLLSFNYGRGQALRGVIFQKCQVPLMQFGISMISI